MTPHRIVILLVALSAGPSSPPAHADQAPSPAELGFYVAAQLDERGQLDEALPLYAARASETLTQHDRLRYAAALLRAGQPEGAKTLFDRLGSEVGSVEHGSAGRVSAPALCASTALLAGSPAVAVPYARAAFAVGRRDAGTGLLLVRALVAAGEPAAARPLLAGLAGEAGSWGDGPRIELARWELATGEVKAARMLLARAVPTSVGQMFQDSVRANLALAERNWQKAAQVLEAAERKVPRSLAEDRKVDGAWRNAQREVRSAAVRRALALWQLGREPAAVAEARRASATDEEYVRAATGILLAAAELAGDRSEDGLARLRVLAGHNHRFREPVDELAHALTDERRAVAPAVEAFGVALGETDRSLDFVTRPLVEVFGEAARHAARPSRAS
jgi:hypothetical protein